MQRKQYPRNNLAKPLLLFQSMPLIIPVTGIKPVKMGYLKSEGYEPYFHRHIKYKELYSQIQGYFN